MDFALSDNQNRNHLHIGVLKVILTNMISVVIDFKGTIKMLQKYNMYYLYYTIWKINKNSLL